MHSGAIIEGDHRYLLWRLTEPDAPRILWVMLNPSTADETEDDPTIRRCLGFSAAWGVPSIEVVNLFSFRATKPSDLWTADEKNGPYADRCLQEAAARALWVIVAWGSHGERAFVRVAQVLRMLHEGGRTPQCLGVTRAGQPRHPLYLSKQSTPEPFCPENVW